jgi:hypothetical protein
VLQFPQLQKLKREIAMNDNANTPAQPIKALSLVAALVTFGSMAAFFASNLMV